MHRFVFRSIELFLTETYGAEFWARVAGQSGVDPSSPISSAHTAKSVLCLLSDAAAMQGKSDTEMVEDIGAWLVQIESIRRLLRFTGQDYRDFVLSLNEFRGRCHMILPDLDIPEFVVWQDDDKLLVRVEDENSTIALQLWTALVSGALRTIADDYGTLALIETPEKGSIEVSILSADFAEDRGFVLAGSLPAGKVSNGARRFDSLDG